MTCRSGVLRVWLTTGPEPGYLAVVTETGLAASVTESAGHIRAGLARRYGQAVVLLEHHLAPELARARRPWTWSASALMAARTGPASGRPRRSIPVTPAWSYGWPPMDTRSSAGRPDGPALARTTRTDRPLLSSI